eukprot:Rhum_TRINITY_DN12236_c0_g1::Rhum_TRINITY_DN12236_c0_g1_i1::g.50372::m.50372
MDIGQKLGKKIVKKSVKGIKDINKEVQVQIGLKEVVKIDRYEAELVPVRQRTQLKIGCKVKTLKHPSTTHAYGELSIYHNKLATVVSFPSGGKMVRLRFEDGNLQHWRYEDLRIHPTEMNDGAPIHHIYGKTHAKPSASGIRSGAKWLDPDQPPPMSTPRDSPAGSLAGDDASQGDGSASGDSPQQRRLSRVSEEEAAKAAAAAAAAATDPDDLAYDADPVKEAQRLGEWVEAADPKTGRPYWWHSETRKTTWNIEDVVGRDVAGGVGGGGKKGPPVYLPEKIVVDAKEGAKARTFGVPGMYRRQDADVNGMPLYRSEKADRWLFSTEGGHWAFTATRDDFFELSRAEGGRDAAGGLGQSVRSAHSARSSLPGESATLVIALEGHGGRAPDASTDWIVNSNGESVGALVHPWKADAAQCALDVFYLLHARQHAHKAGKLAEQVHSGRYTTAEVLGKLCQTYSVDDAPAWTSRDPPKAVVRHILSELLRAEGVAKAEWGHVDTIAARVSSQKTMDSEVAKLCEKQGADAADWVGPYPLALRCPFLSEDAIRLRVEALRATEGGPNASTVSADEVVERVLGGGERFDAVMAQCCRTLGVEPEPWLEQTPVGVVLWLISSFFNAYDPGGRGGEAAPIAADIADGKFTIDDVMRQLCSRWRDRGAEEALWVGEYPEAVRRIAGHAEGTGTNALMHGRGLVGEGGTRVATTTSRGEGGGRGGASGSLREAAEAARFKMMAFQEMQGMTEHVQPAEHLEQKLRASADAADFEARMDEVLEEYMRLCDVPSQLRYLWRGRDPVALLRYRFDRMAESCAAPPRVAEPLRDSLIQQCSAGTLAPPAAIEQFALRLGCRAADWAGPFPPALRGAGAVRSPDEAAPPVHGSRLRGRGSAATASTAPAWETVRGASGSAGSAAPSGRLLGDSVLPQASDSIAARSSGTRGARDLRRDSRDLRQQRIQDGERRGEGDVLEDSLFAATDEGAADGAAGAVSSPVRQRHKETRVLPQPEPPLPLQDPQTPASQAAPRTLGSMQGSRVGRSFTQRVSLVLNVFHEVNGLGFAKIPVWVEQIVTADSPVDSLQGTLRNLCERNGIDPAPWLGQRPLGVLRYVLTEFFTTFDPQSLATVPQYVEMALSPLSSLAAVLMHLCETYGVDKEDWAGDYPAFFKKKAEASQRRCERLQLPLDTPVERQQGKDALRSDVGHLMFML